MKIFNITTFALLSVFSLSGRSASTFTNVTSLDEKYVLAGIKKVEPEMEMESQLLEIDAKKLVAQQIKLPADINNREIVGLIPAKKEFVLVVTQTTTGGGDRPQIHSYHLARREWKKIADVDCISFAEINIEAKSVAFSCEVTDDNGKVSSVVKKVNSAIELKPQIIKLPVSQIVESPLKVSLEGKAFSWNQLKVLNGKKEKIFIP